MHDFGEYKELCLIFDEDMIDRAYDGFEDELDDLSSLFWEFANRAEQFDCEADSITEEIRSCWNELQSKKESTSTKRRLTQAIS